MNQRVIAFSIAAVLTSVLASSAWAAGARESGGTNGKGRPATIEAGYMPILPDSQLFVIEGRHWASEEGIHLKLVRFSDGPAMVQAVASGKLDVMYFGIGPAMVAYAKGVKIRVVASNIVKQIAFIARHSLARFYDPSDPAATFARFTEAVGRKPRIATFPKGSVPDTVLRYWLVKRLGIGTGAVAILGMGASRVQEALLAGKVDGAATLEPILTIVKQRDPSARVLVRASRMFPGQPGAVLAVRDRLIANDPEAVQKLVALQVRATRYLQDDPASAAPFVTDYVGKGLVPVATIARALRSPSTHFMADPAKIVAPSERMLAFQVATGSVSKRIDIRSLFDSSFYRKATGG